MIGTVEDVIQDMKNGVYDFTKEGQCSNCGQCCSDFLPVTDTEIKIIKDYTRKHNIKEQKHFVPTAKPIMFDLMCPFRNNTERKCMIYPVRPLICRDFRCDKPRKEIEAAKELYTQIRKVVSMRNEIFHKQIGRG